MENYELDTSLLQFGSCNPWTIRNAVEGVQVFGGIGSGKTSGSGRMIALKYLKAGFGGLILTVKPDEKELFIEYCKLAGRQNDLMIIEPGGEYSFDFLEYLSAKNDGGAITSNILETLKTVIRAGEEKSSGKSDDPFWQSSLDLLLSNIIDLAYLAYDKIGVQQLYDLVQSVPQQENEKDNDDVAPIFKNAFEKAKNRVKAEISIWYQSLTKEQINGLGDEASYERAMLDAVPNARLLKFLDQFFFDTFKNLSEKTRSIILFSFSSFLYRLLREPVYSLFCKQKVNVKPEDSIDGKIILINLPVKLYHNIGRDCQIIFKYLWQVQMEKRDVKLNGRPVFLFADEAHNFLHEYDSDMQATARSSRIATVYLTQNLSNYYTAMGGPKAEDRIKAFLGTLNTKIMHANAHIEMNKYGSEIIGDTMFIDPNRSITTAEKFSQSDGHSLKIDRAVRPEEFVGLCTGGKRNNFWTEAYIHVQGDRLFNNKNYKKVKFNQNFNNNK